MTFCIRTCRDGSFSSGIWKYTVGRNCDCVGGDCDHATAAIMPDARIVAGTISLFIGHLPELVRIIWCNACTRTAYALRLLAATFTRALGPPASRHRRDQQERREDDQVDHPLQHRGASGAERQRADEQGQYQECQLSRRDAEHELLVE